MGLYDRPSAQLYRISIKYRPSSMKSPIAELHPGPPVFYELSSREQQSDGAPLIHMITGASSGLVLDSKK